MKSGIFKIENKNTIAVVFGGNIAVGSATTKLIKEDKYVEVLSLGYLKNKHDIGELGEDQELHKSNFIVDLLFDNTKSVDIIIEHLQSIKNRLTNGRE